MTSVNCTSLPSIPTNGVLNLTSTSTTIGCATDDVYNAWNTITVMCVNQDVWSHPDLTNLTNSSLPIESMLQHNYVTYIDHLL